MQIAINSQLEYCRTLAKGDSEYIISDHSGSESAAGTFAGKDNEKKQWLVDQSILYTGTDLVVYASAQYLMIGLTR